MDTKSFHYGGQAVIEGVMMRGPEEVVTCVRRPNGTIAMHREHVDMGRPAWTRFPVLRGAAALYESLYYGMRSLFFSVQTAGAEEEKLSDTEMGITMAVSLAAAVGLFFLLPTTVVHWLPEIQGDPVLLNLAEGLIRLVLFLLYLWAISQAEDIRRVFEYHGAEHKTIFCYEKGLPLTADNVRKQSRLHPRCGTNFLMIVMMLSIFVFAFLGWPDLWLRLASRVLLVPLIAGIAYEWLQFAADSEQQWVRIINQPGLYLELLTTREPHDDQIEVAVAALRVAAHWGDTEKEETVQQMTPEEEGVYAG